MDTTAPPKPLTTVHATKCCGLWELDNLGRHEDPAAAMKEVGKVILSGRTSDLYNTNRAVPFVFFTGVTNRTGVDHTATRNVTYGPNFAAFIQAKGLGEVFETVERINPNSKNHIKVWMWAVDHEALTKFLASV